MAKYTELFAEYLESGGELPAAFADIDGFEDLFKGYYIDKEIGFETEVLFKIKLETYANLIIPVYVERIENFKTAYNKILNPSKSRNTTYTRGQRKTTSVIAQRTNTSKLEAGEQAEQNWDLPFNGNTADPSGKAHNDAYENNTTDTLGGGTDEQTQASYIDTDTLTETGLTAGEALSYAEFYRKELENLKMQCLKEFKPLFMQVY